jgi:hypothetical protein
MSSENGAANEWAQNLREKILFGLSIYKFVSPTMLHVFLGTSIPSALWKDEVLTKLIEEGLVIQENVSLTSPLDRSQSYTVLRLAENAYIPPETPAAATSPQSCADETEQPEQPAAA